MCFLQLCSVLRTRVYICTRCMCVSIKICTSSSPPRTYEHVVTLEILQMVKKNSGGWSKVNEKFVQGADPGTDSSSLRLSSIWQETINKYLWSGIKRNILLNISKHEASAVVTLLYYPSVSSHVIFYDENWFICDSGNFFMALGGCYFNSWDPSSRSVVCNPVINGSVRETSDMFSFLLPDFNKYCLWVLTICFQSSIKIVIVEQWFLVVVVVVFCCCCCFLHFFQVSHLLK